MKQIIVLGFVLITFGCWPAPQQMLQVYAGSMVCDPSIYVDGPKFNWWVHKRYFDTNNPADSWYEHISIAEFKSIYPVGAPERVALRNKKQRLKSLHLNNWCLIRKFYDLGTYTDVDGHVIQVWYDLVRDRRY